LLKAGSTDGANQVAQASIQFGLENSKAGDFTASLGSLLQCLTLLIVKNFSVRTLIA